MRKAVIFDVDGTLWDAVDAITDSWEETAHKFPEVTTTLDEGAVRQLMGQPMDAFVRLLPELPKERAMEIIELCAKEEIDYLHRHPGHLYPGMKETIECLAKKYELYIVSNCQVGYIEALLETCGLEEYFKDFENFGRTGKKKGENIRILMQRCEIDKAVYIGDTQTDYEATIEAGIPFIYAAYGMGQVEHARFQVSAPQEIPQEIERMKYFAL